MNRTDRQAARKGKHERERREMRKQAAHASFERQHAPMRARKREAEKMERIMRIVTNVQRASRRG